MKIVLTALTTALVLLATIAPTLSQNLTSSTQASCAVRIEHHDEREDLVSRQICEVNYFDDNLIQVTLNPNASFLWFDKIEYSASTLTVSTESEIVVLINASAATYDTNTKCATGEINNYSVERNSQFMICFTPISN